MLNPLGVPSRMNIGQVLSPSGSGCQALGFKIETPVFNGADEEDIMQTLELANDYVNKSQEEFTELWKDRLSDETYKYLERQYGLQRRVEGCSDRPYR